MASTTSRIKLPKSLVVIALLASGVILSAAWPSPPIETFDETSGVSDALLALGDDKPLHYTPNRDTALTRMGFEIITEGRTKGPDGKMGRRQSKYFTCTHCHNVEREDPDLKISDPDARLGYTSKNGLPFLQGTTLWGIVNRESWYNDDYLLKYGDLVADSRDTLYNAIHLCAVECSQGRPLEDWELEAVMTYLYSIEITLGDLGFTDDQYTELHQIVAGGTDQKKKDAIGWIKQQFMTKSPATFMYPQSVDHRKLGANGDPTNGALVYETSCQHCHSPGGATNYVLDNSKITFNRLENHLRKQGNQSVYQITRKGTYAIPGYRPYMPHYTKQRMSDQQLEDLIAYINQKANG